MCKSIFLPILTCCLILLSASCTKHESDDNDSVKLSVDYNQAEGSVVCDPQKTVYEVGQEVSLTATPKEGYEFQEWNLPDATILNSHSIKYTLSEDATIKAVFKKKEQIVSYHLSVTYNATQGIVNISPNKESYAAGDQVRMEAVAKDGFLFDKWEGISESNAAVTMTINSNLNVSALFKPQEASATNPEFSFVATRIKDQSGTLYYHIQVDFAPVTSAAVDATLKLNGMPYELKNNRLDQNFTDMPAGTKLNITLEHTSLGKPMTTSIVVPESFTNSNDRLVYSDKNDNQLTWKSLNCNGYVRRLKAGNLTGCVEYGYEEIVGQTELTYHVDQLLAEYSGNSNMPYSRYAISVMPVNRVTAIDGFTSSSNIVVSGLESKWITNYKAPDYWRIW